MAPKKATAKSPKPKTTPARKAKAEIVEVPSEAGLNNDGLDAETAQDGIGSGDDSGPGPEAVTPARKGGKRKASQDEGDEVESPGAKKPKVSSSSVKVSETVTESGGGKKKHAHRNVKVEIPLSTPVTKSSGKHIVFNDDDGPAEFFTPQEAPAQELLDAQLSEAGGAGGRAGEEDDDEGSDSDDDAPEAVSTQTAAAQAAKSAQAATRAAEKQLEQQKRKRQERDARLKQQAETRKKHQAASDKKAAAAAAADVAEAEASPEPAQRGHLPSVSAAPTRKRLDKRSLPDVLPDDFLASASEDDDTDRDDDQQEDARGSRKPKPNTLARQMAKAESRRPQDQRVGSTVYRVTRRQEDPSLAPKAHRHSQNTKEVLLRRQRPVSRKGGFLVKKRK